MQNKQKVRACLSNRDKMEETVTSHDPITGVQIGRRALSSILSLSFPWGLDWWADSSLL